MNFETKINNLGITEEVENIIANCECGEVNEKYIVELCKLRKWEIIETIGNYLDPMEEEVEWWDIKQLQKFCNVFGISKEQVADYYALALCDGAEEIAYVINKDIVLVVY